MSQRLGEIILIQYPEITFELYSDCALAVGHIVSLEDERPIGIVNEIVTVCIEEGRTTQALGKTHFTDEELQRQYPHLKNSTRRLAKVLLYDEIFDLAPNQGVYDFVPTLDCYAQKNYWHCLQYTSFSVLKKHLHWLETHSKEFEIKKYIKDLSSINKPLAWELFMERFS